ncbi:hypothetical protein LEMLEM_LOCUS3723 [Lemmus lemmus]
MLFLSPTCHVNFSGLCWYLNSSLALQLLPTPFCFSPPYQDECQPHLSIWDNDTEVCTTIFPALPVRGKNRCIASELYFCGSVVNLRIHFLSKDYRDYRNPESDALFKVTELWLKAQVPGSFWCRFWSRKHPTFRHQPAQPAFPLPPDQNEATSASAINRVVRVETSPSSPENHPDPAPGGQLQAPAAAGSARASTTPPAAGASLPPASQAGGSSARARGQRARPRERAGSGARDRDARACARPEGAGALRVGVGVRARCGPRLCGLKQRAKRRRPRAEGTRGPRAAGTDGFGADAGAPAGHLGLAAACVAGAGRFPGPEWPPPRETRRDTGLRRGAAGVCTARTRAARCAAGRGGDQRRGRCSPRGP